MHMRWKELLFMHWRFDPAVLRPHIPASLTLESFDGSAWLGVVPFLMTETYPLPEAIGGAVSRAIGAYEFPELNVRTYVRVGGMPGVFFFSLDAASRTAVRLARASFRLPYFDARMGIDHETDGFIRFTSDRTQPGASTASFDVRYRPEGKVQAAEPGTLEHFLTERYALYTTVFGRPLRAHIHHEPWPLQRADVRAARIEMTPFLPGVDLDPGAALCHYARDQRVVGWPLTPAF